MSNRSTPIFSCTLCTTIKTFEVRSSFVPSLPAMPGPAATTRCLLRRKDKIIQYRLLPCLQTGSLSLRLRLLCPLPETSLCRSLSLSPKLRGPWFPHYRIIKLSHYPIGYVLAAQPNTLRSTSVVRAATLVRILASSLLTWSNSASTALPTTYAGRSGLSF